jgi:hypothetical protein
MCLFDVGRDIFTVCLVRALSELQSLLFVARNLSLNATVKDSVIPCFEILYFAFDSENNPNMSSFCSQDSKRGNR